ncbi:MAG: hypothetical protein HRU03_01900 [Nanoarchaeales archaeon]|nr:hypothetical protein [Nanoarchaeales archaeon]
MINYILIFYISYFVTFLGYLLAKEEVVIDELKEIQKPITYTLDALLLLSYGSLLYFLSSYGFIIFITIILLLIKLISIVKKIDSLKQIHNVLLYSITFMYSYTYLESSFMFITIFPILILFIENTNQKLELKTEFVKFVFLTIMLILLSVL